MFVYTTRGLFEADKLTFTAQVAFQVGTTFIDLIYSNMDIYIYIYIIDLIYSKMGDNCISFGTFLFVFRYC